MTFRKTLIGTGIIVATFFIITFLVGFFTKSHADDTPIDVKDLVPRFSYGVLLNATKFEIGDDGQYHGELLTGLGFEIGVNAWNKADDFNLVGVSFAQTLSGHTGVNQIVYAWGLMLKTFGNFTIGATYDCFDTNDGSGFWTGDSSWRNNGAFLVQLVLPLNGGGAIFNAGK